MHELIISALLTYTALAGVTTTPATARPAGVNGQIVFSRYDDPFTVMFTVNPDGSHQQQVVLNPALPPPKECPRWPPDGTRIATCGRPDNDAALIVNADDGSYRELAMPEPETLFTVCPIWSPDAERLACESFGQIDPSLNRIYTIRSSDGGGLPRMTTNPGGDDLLGDYSPDGRRFMFARSDQNSNPVELLVVNVVPQAEPSLFETTPMNAAAV
jgi:Tol biopolymer transport system component